MQLIGLARLGRDAEIRFTNDGEPAIENKEYTNNRCTIKE